MNLILENWRNFVNEAQTEKSKEELDKISDELKGAVKMHQSQADRIDKMTKDSDEKELEEGKKNCGCGQDPCITYGIRSEAKNEEGK